MDPTQAAVKAWWFDRVTELASQVIAQLSEIESLRLKISALEQQIANVSPSEPPK